jgi:hypothetical protein
MGSVLISWTAPTENSDGSPVSDLSGYKLYYGTSSGDYTTSVDVGNTLSGYIVGLTSGITYYFAVTAYDESDNESTYSDEFSQLIA